MNYSKYGTAKKQKEIKSTEKKVASMGGISLVRIIIVAIVALAIMGCSAAWGAFRAIVDKAPDISTINVVPTGYSTTVYDSEGNELNRLSGAGANRIYKKLDEIPKQLQNAFIAIEDERFYEHGGIDIRGIFRAGIKGAIGLLSGKKVQGASTITQQLLKNQVFEGGNEATPVQAIERKLQEQALAIKLEHAFTKNEILEYYLNTINLGQNTLGVQTAAQRYFNKDVSELTLSECAVIAGITKSPVYNNPINYPENNAGRRGAILNNMLEQGMITKEEYDEASADDVYARIQAVNNEFITSGKYIYSYYVDKTINQVVEDLMEKKGYTATQAYNLVNSGGLSIYTNQDMAIQKICDEAVANEDFYKNVPEKWQLTYALSVQKEDESITNYSEGHIKNMFNLEDMLFAEQEDALPYIEEFKSAVVGSSDKIIGENYSFTIEPQVSVCVMDQKTGEVKAIVGGRGDKTGNLTLNRATDTVRQPGSLFKVLSTYLPAIDTAGYTLAHVEDDSPYRYPNSDKFVENWWGKEYRGLSTARQGIYQSMNIVTLKILEKVGLSTSFDYLYKLGFSTLVDDDVNMAVGLGGLTNGVTNVETTAAFGAIANNGVYVSPSFYSKVLDHDGNVILENEPIKKQVMKESTSFLLKSAMGDVLKKPDATAPGARLANRDMDQAAKTGSSTYYNDVWISGFTPYYTCTVWAGFDSNKDQSRFSMYHQPIWKSIMDQIHEGKETAKFDVPDTITKATICTKCGKLAVEGLCSEAEGGSCVAEEYFAVGTVPTAKCDCHVKIRICKDSKLPASEFCPEDRVKEKVYLIKEESITQNNEKGEAVTIEYKTRDTKNILPKKYEDRVCNIHRSADDDGPQVVYYEGEEDNDTDEE